LVLGGLLTTARPESTAGTTPAHVPPPTASVHASAAPPPLPPLISDGQFVFGPDVKGFDTAAYLRRTGSSLVEYADALTFWCAYTSINPRLVLTLIEMQSGLVQRNPNADPDRPVGYPQPGFERQVEALTIALATAFYDHLYTYGTRAERPPSPGVTIPLTLGDGTPVSLPADLNSGTCAVATALAPLYNRDDWTRLFSPSHPLGFAQTYHRLFPHDDPLDTSNRINAPSAPPPDLLQFPFPVGSR